MPAFLLRRKHVLHQRCRGRPTAADRFTRQMFATETTEPAIKNNDILAIKKAIFSNFRTDLVRLLHGLTESVKMFKNFDRFTAVSDKESKRNYTITR